MKIITNKIKCPICNVGIMEKIKKCKYKRECNYCKIKLSKSKWDFYGYGGL